MSLTAIEPPSKRPRLASVFPDPIPASQDLNVAREENDRKLRSAFQSIFNKYSQDFTGIGDEFVLKTGEIVVDNGHIIGLKNDGDVGTEKQHRRRTGQRAQQTNEKERHKTPGGKLLTAVMMEDDSEQELGMPLGEGIRELWNDGHASSTGIISLDEDDSSEGHDHLSTLHANTTSSRQPRFRHGGSQTCQQLRSCSPSSSVDSLLEMAQPGPAGPYYSKISQESQLEIQPRPANEFNNETESDQDFVARWIASNPANLPRRPNKEPSQPPDFQAQNQPHSSHQWLDGTPSISDDYAEASYFLSHPSPPREASNTLPPSHLFPPHQPGSWPLFYPETQSEIPNSSHKGGTPVKAISRRKKSGTVTQGTSRARAISISSASSSVDPLQED
ncbi:MAG: hypothetical protein Q9227_007462 [Pyrenula ochraceoflavens]